MQVAQVEVALPVTVVELVHMKLTDGSPVRVRCEAVDEMVMLELFGLPGASPPAAGDEDATSATDSTVEVKALMAMAPPLVHDATVLLLGDREVRPAFHCDDSHATPGSIPWRMVQIADKQKVVVGILQNSGARGAAEASFSGGDGKGSGDGLGTDPPGEGLG